MKRNWKIVANVIAMSISIWFILNPTPLAMASFVFIAQPLFLAVIFGYLLSVWRDLRRRQVV